jgi:hypothetical protein
MRNIFYKNNKKCSSIGSRLGFFKSQLDRNSAAKDLDLKKSPKKEFISIGRAMQYSIRVTRRVCEKMDQNVAHTIFSKKSA